MNNIYKEFKENLKEYENIINMEKGEIENKQKVDSVFKGDFDNLKNKKITIEQYKEKEEIYKKNIKAIEQNVDILKIKKDIIKNNLYYLLQDELKRIITEQVKKYNNKNIGDKRQHDIETTIENYINELFLNNTSYNCRVWFSSYYYNNGNANFTFNFNIDKLCENKENGAYWNQSILKFTFNLQRELKENYENNPYNKEKNVDFILADKNNENEKYYIFSFSSCEKVEINKIHEKALFLYDTHKKAVEKIEEYKKIIIEEIDKNNENLKNFLFENENLYIDKYKILKSY